jgi:hypothetical protein
MSDLTCPKCSGARWIPLKAIFAYRRDWRGRWRKVRTLDVVGCDHCKRIYEVSESGTIAMVEDAPREQPKPAAHDDDEPRERTHALSDAVRRPEV